MRRAEMLLHAFIVFIVLSSTFASDILDCSPKNFSIGLDKGIKIDIKQPRIQFKYDRNDLQIYQYPGTPSVNLFINSSEILMRGGFDNNGMSVLGINNEKFFNAEVIGIANLVNISSNNKGLKDCEFFLLDKRTRSFYNGLTSPLDGKVFQQVEQCVNTYLCDVLGVVYEEDAARGRANPRDFGPLSIWSRTLHIDFPKMMPPRQVSNADGQVVGKPVNLVDAADTIVGMVSEMFQSGNNGIIQIPDIKHGIFAASKGTFSGLNNLQRDANIQVRASPPNENPMVFSFNFGIPQGHITYKKFKAFRIMPIVGSLCADVQDMLFNAVIQMDFSRKLCSTNLKVFNIVSSGTSKSYTCGRLSFLTNPVMRWFVNAWDQDIVQAIGNQIEFAMAAYVYDKFDCEAFRPK